MFLVYISQEEPSVLLHHMFRKLKQIIGIIQIMQLILLLFRQVDKSLLRLNKFDFFIRLEYTM
ncbi:MAG: hypothetical protein EBY07_13535 [Actinobacteria bacterium]|nr:hypothetical protein [Actinomycetota bacterium]